ncbi:auxin-responsive protein SAUR36-like [Macadamia integrifolia]|uniref:auxin-responsive protein SAUR36-like n=1 Tax=Macadamia integrifolia TaxID=60698 RepID=UPI001C501B65|nr:auxin-responsive protein SAUR36-like [Macadamia integrifolia]
MRKTQGFKLGRKLLTVFKWALKRKRKRGGYRALQHPPSQSSKSKTISKLCDWGRNLKRGAKGLCSGKSGWRYARLGREQSDAKPATAVPKGHLAVYVGEKDGYPHRVLVPVFYFNHPLFAELLREAEEEFGFQHPGGITIPCRISDFESVQTRIAAGESFRKQALKYRI